ncbi:uncharacterized protein N7477_000839 [Penicillium maclennaniae]|uniref:uncharacterized protein n=1 Tax=Penicillium maclennaniae TaxID=1343394 RepID=UPI002540168C|nr:uncharacterized protein N7477_000839 [Penicillium maclennaniae]KAJ5684494.1 hypothetical protein N7477_000839 [Penicillium maclennaniae]
MIIKASDSEAFSGCIAPTGSEGNGEILAILAADACMPIAIVGMGFRGPGDATDVQKLWEMIIEQREAWGPIPKERWNNKAFYHPDHARHGAINVKEGHFMKEDLSLFDAPFFNMTGDEAAAMDPQQRLLLEVTYEAVENAGIPLSQFTGSKTSCFVGSFSADYTDLLLRDPECVPMYQCTNAGQSRAMVSNRISYFFDLKGPSVTVDTACSGSLVALHLACQSLRTGDASMAVAAGVNLILSHEFMSTMSMMRFLSPDGRCYTFDERANGYARGEAVDCLILKPLVDALRDHNKIRAIIRGSGSNQDGRTPGITLPSGTAQETLMRDVYARAGLDPKETEVVESHGTGTQAGDPIETAAISRVLGLAREAGQTVKITSIKTNVGHLEGASGVAGVIKAVLMLENRMILPNRNFKTPNPRIPLEEWSLKVQSTPEQWETPGHHRVSVNSFGYGGSNAHVVIEDAIGYLTSRGLQQWLLGLSDSVEKAQLDFARQGWPSQRSRIFVLSGFDEQACKEQVRRIHDYLVAREGYLDHELMDDLAFTLNERRTRFMWKTAVIGDSVSTLIDVLSGTPKIRSSVRDPTLAFVFTGQGAQWDGMGKELLLTYPVFRESIAMIDAFLETLRAPFSVYDEMTGDPEDSHLSHPLLSQTLCSALQIALVDLLASWGVYPASVTGHSSGEIAAAYASGALSLEDAMSIAYHRGVIASQLLTAPVSGGMMAIGMSPAEVQPLLARINSGKAVIACVNSPHSVTVSGDAEAIDEIAKALQDSPVLSRQLAVAVAYHSHHMELVSNEYLKSIDQIVPKKPNNLTGPISFFSSVTGTELEPEALGPRYWVSNLLGQVKFAESVKKLCFETNTRYTGIGTPAGRRMKRVGTAQKPSVDVILEIGPHSALSAPVKQILQADVKLKAADIEYASVLVRRQDAVSCALDAMTKLASLNYSLDFKSINRPVAANTGNPPRTGLLGALDNVACPFEPRWRNHLRVSEIPWLLDHKIQSDIVFPAAGYMCIAIDAAMQLVTDIGEIAAFVLQRVSIRSALIIPETAGIEIMTSLHFHAEQADRLHSGYRFHIYSVSKENRWTEHCTGIVQAEKKQKNTAGGKIGKAEGAAMLPESDSTDVSVVNIDHLYERLRHVGLDYGPCFSNMKSAQTSDDGICFAEITLPNTAAVMPMQFEHPLLIHPCTLDSLFHAMFAMLSDKASLEKGPMIPVSIENLRVATCINSSAGQVFSACTHVRTGPEDTVLASIVAAEISNGIHSSEPKLSVKGLRCKRLDIATNDSKSSKHVALIYGIEWQPDPGLLLGNVSSYRILEQHVQSVEQTSLREEYEKQATSLIKDFVVRYDQLGQTQQDTLVSKYRSHFAELLQRHNALEEISQITDIGDRQREIPQFMTRPLRAIKAYVSSIFNGDDRDTQTSRLELWDSRWEILAADRTYLRAAKHLALLGNKKPDISVLEICEGTGQPCTMLLESLATGFKHPHLIPCCTKYSFTYKDNSELEQLKSKVTRWPELAGYTKLDIERDISGQGLEKNSYDVIVAPHGLYSVHSVKTALSNFRSLLKPSGYLLIIDNLYPERSILDAIMSSALYPWPIEKLHLPSSNVIERRSLVQALHDADFTIRYLAGDGSENSDNGTLMLSSLQGNKEFAKRSFTIISERDRDQIAVTILQRHLEDLGCLVTLTDMIHVQAKNQVCVVLSDTQNHVLAGMDVEMLEKVKDVFLHSAGVLWITRGGTINPNYPEAGLALGFARTARSESAVEPIVTLDLDSLNPLPGPEVAELIFRMIKTRFLQKGHDTDDTEYAERNGVVLIPRVIEREDAASDVIRAGKENRYSQRTFQQKDCPLRLSRADKDHFQPYFTVDQQMTQIPAGHVGIEVMAFGLNECDEIQYPEVIESRGTLGLECSGKVYALGEGVEGLAIGDRVMCLGDGTARTLYHAEASACHKLNAFMSYELAASIPVAYTTAYYVVHYLARVRPHDIILIEDAASWYGQAIIELCYMRSATVIAIVKNVTQEEALINRFHIPPDRALIEGEEDILKRLLEITHGRKADVAITFSATTSESMKMTWGWIAPFGRFIRLHTRKTEIELDCDVACPGRNGVFSTFNIFAFQRARTDLTRHILGKIIRFFRNGRLLGPSSLMVKGVGDVEQALEMIPSEKHVVMTTGADDKVTTLLPKQNNKLFRSDASYILVGGLGGIGRVIALWMADQGAKHLILINRSGLSRQPAQNTVSKIQGKGVTVTIHACDIADEAQVSQVFATISQNQPPIRGLIHGAMILKDVHIEKMTSQDYNTVLQPRYTGTWNLHRNLPTELDFFLMLSSISGVIGNATQSAYAAGSAFMDAFAAYRNAMGLPGVSLDLGTITDIGYLASNKDLAAQMERQGFQGTDTPTLLRLVEFAISQPVVGGMSQIVTGLGEWKEGQSLGNFDTPLFSHYRRRYQVGEDGGRENDTDDTLKGMLRACKTKEEAVPIIFDVVSGKIAAQLDISVDRVDPSSPLSEFGADSQMAVELRNWILKTLESTLSILEILASESVLHLARQIAERSQLVCVDNDEQ